MITQAKKISESIDTNQIPVVKFLTLDGSLVSEVPVLHNNVQYVSSTDHNKYGKVEQYTNNIKFFLKQFRGGRPGELLVDPYGMFAKAEDLSAYVNQRGHRFCEYVQVPAEIFHGYEAYLQSRDVRYLRYCEKYLLDNVK